MELVLTSAFSECMGRSKAPYMYIFKNVMFYYIPEIILSPYEHCTYLEPRRQARDEGNIHLA